MQKIRLYTSKTVYAVAVAFCVLIAAFIFGMSHEAATESASRSGTISNVLAPIVVEDFELLQAEEKDTILSEIDHVVRKIAHFCIYAIFGVFILLASFWHERAYAVHGSVSFAIGTLYAASDEIHQMFVPGRGPLATDVLLDSAGVLCGIVSVIACARIIMRKKRAS